MHVYIIAFTYLLMYVENVVFHVNNNHASRSSLSMIVFILISFDCLFWWT